MIVVFCRFTRWEKIDEIVETISMEAKDALEEVCDNFIEKGIEKGIEKTAIKMIYKGYSYSQIAEVTDLNQRQIGELRTKNTL